jgi:RNA polymerase sigma factor (TIGR02999 family)
VVRAVPASPNTTITPTVNFKNVPVMALSPSDGQDAALTLECGNAGLQGEHHRKCSRNVGFSAEQPVEDVQYCPIEKGLETPLPGAVTALLRAWRDGDDGALEQLTPLVEAELRRLARGYMRRERRGHTLQTTALVNEAFLRLTDARRVRWQDRAHFLGISARLMRRVLVDHARSRAYRKRGGGAQRVTLDEGLVTSPEPAVDVRKSRVIELRFFGGLSVEETAEVLHVSADTVKRDWRLAKLWLLRELEGAGP